MLEQLLPHVPDRPPAQEGAHPCPQPGAGQGHQAHQDAPGDPGVPQDRPWAGPGPENLSYRPTGSHKGRSGKPQW
jgi:hypothetical protein